MREFDIKRAVGGGGYHDKLTRCLDAFCLKKHRGVDAKRQSLLRLGDFDLYKKFVDILSLFKRNILISPLEGEKKFLSELCELRNYREGFNLKRSCRNSSHSKSIATLREEAEKYKPYLAYTGAGYLYNGNVIDQQLDYLKTEIEETIVIVKEAR